MSQIGLGYVVSQYPATNHTFILREIQTLRRDGFDIHVISIRKPDRRAQDLSADEAEESRLTYHVLGAGPAEIAGSHARTFFSSPLAYLGALAYALRLAEWNIRKAAQYLLYFGEAVVAGDVLRRRGVRHTHTHFASTVTLILAKLFPIGMSVTIHGPDEFNDVAGFHMAEKVARSTFISTISRFASSQTMRASDPLHWGKIHALPLGVDPSAFLPRAAPAGETFHILCVGRLAPAKAHHILIESVRRLIAQGRTNVVLTLVGDGPSRPSLEQMVAANDLGAYVRLAGACNHDRVIEFYQQTDVFALASFAEGVPVVLMEAMAMEIPCVTTWIAGVPELIRGETDGVLIQPADPEALAAAIARLMDDPELCLRLGRSARERVVQCYDLARNTKQLGQTFRRYLA